ncbi:MAG: phage baseplate assembly protein V [Nitrospira sp.]|jgi:uncharacterized protein involved in type VI secretion and phage assembly|nr:phage baseplate assembly protein V [Nitrospira sp.]
MSLLEVLQPDQQENGTMEGVAIGIVTNNKDPDGLGRVKVRFPWRENSRESYWARVVATGAGKDRGLYWVPEVNDEVLLVCDKKDIQHIFVVGSLWNGKDKPAADNADGENNTRLIRSRSGHEIRLFDKKGQGKVEIKSEKGHTVTMDDQQSTIEIKDSGGSNKITISATQNGITIESGLSMTLKSQSISIEAGATMTLKASGALILKGTPILLN